MSVIDDRAEYISDDDLRYEHNGLRDLIDTLLNETPDAMAGIVRATLKTYHDFRASPPGDKEER